MLWCHGKENIYLILAEQQFKFEPGEYSYNFSATLPTHIPISFDGQYGYVRYKIMVGIDRRLNRHHYEETFIVIKDIDLNHFPYLKVSYLFVCCNCEIYKYVL